MSSGAVVPAAVLPARRTRRSGELASARLILLGITVVAAAIRLWRIRHQSYWYDEGFTVSLVRQPFDQMISSLPNTEITPPLYYSLAWVWGQIFGYGEAGLRSLSALAGVATIPAAYAAAARLVSPRVGLSAAALVACNPLLIWYSQEARSYAVLVLFSTLSLLAFAHLRTPHPSTRRLAAWAVAAGLTIATHYYGVLAVAPQALWLLWIHRLHRRIVLTVASVGAVGVALLPMAIGQRSHANWIAGWPLSLRLGQIPSQFLIGTGAPARTWLTLAGAAAVAAAIAILALRADDLERRGALIAGALAASGLVIGLVLIVFGTDEIITRNVIVMLVPLIILVSAGLGARRAGVVGLGGATALCAVGLTAAIGVAVTPDLQRPDWRDAAKVIGPASGGTSRAIVLEDYPAHNLLMPLRLYLTEARHLENPASVNELDVVAFWSPPTSIFCWWGAACNLVPVRLDATVHVPGFQVVGPVRHAGGFSILRLRSASPLRLGPVGILRALPPRRPGSYTILIERPPK